MLYTGVDIGGTKCAVTLGTENGKILRKIRFETTDLECTLNNIISAIEELGAGSAIGISCGGPLDSKRGVILSPPNLPGWDNVHITDIMKSKFGVPAYLKNDADACALAEWKFGAGKKCDNMIFLTFGTGLGAGLILSGRLYSGSSDAAGEAGHIRLSEFGSVGYGKAGSFEGFCSGGGIAQLGKMLATESLQCGKAVSYCKSFAELDGITAKSIAEAADEGNADAKEVYRLSGEKLGYGLSILIDLLNPQKIVIGSIFQRSGHLMKDAMYRVLEKECLPASLAVCEILPAELGDEIGDYAALTIAAEGENL